MFTNYTQCITIIQYNLWVYPVLRFLFFIKYCLFLIFLTETISRTDEGQPRPKYIFNKRGNNICFFYSKEVWSITITEFQMFSWFFVLRFIFYEGGGWRIRGGWGIVWKFCGNALMERRGLKNAQYYILVCPINNGTITILF